jgi:hypothetical protein
MTPIRQVIISHAKARMRSTQTAILVRRQMHIDRPARDIRRSSTRSNEACSTGSVSHNDEAAHRDEALPPPSNSFSFLTPQNASPIHSTLAISHYVPNLHHHVSFNLFLISTNYNRSIHKYTPNLQIFNTQPVLATHASSQDVSHATRPS